MKLCLINESAIREKNSNFPSKFLSAAWLAVFRVYLNFLAPKYERESFGWEKIEKKSTLWSPITRWDIMDPFANKGPFVTKECASKASSQKAKGLENIHARLETKTPIPI